MVLVEVDHLNAVKFEARARTHVIQCDQPPEFGGSDTAMTPPELLLSALGCCAGYYAVQYLKKHDLLMDGTHVRVSAEKKNVHSDSITS